jgi:hypothetical protein
MFITDPAVVPISTSPDLWYLSDPLVWKEPGMTITIPAGFISDMASVPKVLDWIPFLDRQGLSRRPGLAHDGLYALGRSHGKQWCDLMLEQFCISEGMSGAQAHAYYLGVHWFGGYAWACDATEGIVSRGPITSGDFISQSAYDAWVASGRTIYS